MMAYYSFYSLKTEYLTVHCWTFAQRTQYTISNMQSLMCKLYYLHQIGEHSNRKSNHITTEMILTKLMKSPNDEQKGTEIIFLTRWIILPLSFIAFFRHKRRTTKYFYSRRFYQSLQLYLLIYILFSELFFFCLLLV